MSTEPTRSEMLKTGNGSESEGNDAGSAAETPAPRPPLSPAAKRALAEAEERRKAADARAQAPEREIGGRGGADPARFGDWEINGRAIDF